MLRRDMQTQTKYVIGVDFGSDSVRCLIVGTADGAEIASAVAAYPRWKERLYCDPSLNRYRQHPLDYIESLEQCVRSALEKCGKEVADNICGISFDTTASTPALTDERGVPLALLPEYAENPDAMFVLWKDHTALAEADEINDLAKRWEVDYTRYSGGAYSCEWVWAKMLHCLRSDPALRAKTCSWVEHCDWICALLTGDTKPETIARSRCAAGHKAMWHESWGGLPSPEFLSAVDPLLDIFRGHLYTRTVTGDECIGGLCPEWAARLGLRSGIAVGVGAIDCHVGAVGAGIVPGTLVKVMGTSHNTSVPFRVKIGCRRMEISTSRSPFGPPPTPTQPSPRTRTLCPASTPAGIFTLTRLVLRTLPLPRQVVQGFLMTLPRPPQVGQVVVDCICMPMKFCTERT